VQATVSSFDPATSSGELLLDDGVRLRFGADALQGGGLLHLRPGQRVHIEADGTVVRAVAIIAR
jgi:cold shock CspA family protein